MSTTLNTTNVALTDGTQGGAILNRAGPFATISSEEDVIPLEQDPADVGVAQKNFAHKLAEDHNRNVLKLNPNASFARRSAPGWRPASRAFAQINSAPNPEAQLRRYASSRAARRGMNRIIAGRARGLDFMKKNDPGNRLTLKSGNDFVRHHAVQNLSGRKQSIAARALLTPQQKHAMTARLRDTAAIAAHIVAPEITTVVQALSLATKAFSRRQQPQRHARYDMAPRPMPRSRVKPGMALAA